MINGIVWFFTSQNLIPCSSHLRLMAGMIIYWPPSFIPSLQPFSFYFSHWTLFLICIFCSVSNFLSFASYSLMIPWVRNPDFDFLFIDMLTAILYFLFWKGERTDQSGMPTTPVVTDEFDESLKKQITALLHLIISLIQGLRLKFAFWSSRLKLNFRISCFSFPFRVFLLDCYCII